MKPRRRLSDYAGYASVSKPQNELGNIVKKQAHRQIREWLEAWGLEGYVANPLAQHLLEEVINERIRKTNPTSPDVFLTDTQKIEQLVLAAQQAAAALDEADLLMPLVDKLADASEANID